MVDAHTEQRLEGTVMRDHERDPYREQAPRRSDVQRQDHQPQANNVSPAHGPPLDAASVLRLQRTAGNQSVGALLEAEREEASPVHDVIGSGGGSPLDADTRTTMEATLGGDFSDVRIHTDATASESARAVNAHAYTVQNQIVFDSGAYAPGTDAGRRTLAHELTHVMQQREGAVDGTPQPGGIRVSDPSDRFEQAAERTAEVATARSSSAASPAAGAVSMAGAAGAASSVQRQATEEEELPTPEAPGAETMPPEEEEEAAPA